MSTTQSPHNGLDGQIALVTGATAGLGRAIALQLAHDGADVIVHGRSAERGAQDRGGDRRRGRHRPLRGGRPQRPDAVRMLAQEVGELDILINNAGFSEWGPTGRSTCPPSTPCSPATSARRSSCGGVRPRRWPRAAAAP